MHSHRMRTALTLLNIQEVSLTETPPGQRPPSRTESQTGVKTLPCRNFVAGGKISSNFSRECEHNYVNQPDVLDNTLFEFSRNTQVGNVDNFVQLLMQIN